MTKIREIMVAETSPRTVPALLMALLMMGAASGAGSGSFDATEFSVEIVDPPASPKWNLLDDDPCWPLDFEGNELAWALESLHTRDARQLVWVMQKVAAGSDRLTLHLAIAHAETRGRILSVSAAGAAGLAQATPIAILAEGVEGPLFITPDYVRGAEAYFLKKPLGDADAIATFLLAGGRRERALEFLSKAWTLRTEGLDDLDHLRPFADEAFDTRRARSEEDNAATLERLSELIREGAPRVVMERFRDETRSRYRELRNVQRRSWRAYRDDLSSSRDALLREVYGAAAASVFETAAYDAGEILASRLDVRFSPTLMADFLSRHLDTKRAQALELGIGDAEIERVAIGLYNSGTPNIKRMMAGLITSLPETDAYMEKVPGVRDTLESSLTGTAH